MSVLSLQINASSDDSMRWESTGYNGTSFATYVGYNDAAGEYCSAAYRFTGAEILAGKVIDQITLKPYAFDIRSGKCIVDIGFVDQDDPTAPTNSATFDALAASLTSVKASNYVFPQFAATGRQTINAPANLTTSLQSVVSRPGFSGNLILMILYKTASTDHRGITTQNQSPNDRGFILDIEYASPSDGTSTCILNNLPHDNNDIVISNDPLTNDPLNHYRIAWWLAVPGLTGGSKWIDLVNNEDLTIVGENPATIWQTSTGGELQAGRYGWLNLNGSTYTTRSNFNTKHLGECSISCWVKSANINAARYAVSLPNTTAGNVGFDIWLGNLTLSSYLLTTVGGLSLCQVSYDYTNQNNGWCHLVAAYDGRQHRLYANGVLISSTTNSGPLNTAANEITVGRFSSATGSSVTGSIDSVSIWSRGLTNADVAALYEQERTSATGLLRHPTSVATITLAQNYTFQTDQGIFDSIGYDSNRIISRKINPTKGTSITSGYSTNFKFTRKINLETNNITITGKNINFRIRRNGSKGAMKYLMLFGGK